MRPAGTRLRQSLVLLVLLAGAAGTGSKPTAQTGPGSAKACRTVPSAYTSSTGAGAFKATITGRCSFDPSGTRASCAHEYRDTNGTSSTSTSVTLYNSIADFVDETQVIPPLMRAVYSSGKMVSGATTTTGSTVNTYDPQGRITRTENNPGLPGASITTFTAWESAGRPTVAQDVGRGFSNRRDITYDDTARTRTTRVNGGLVVTVETFDANGNLTSQMTAGKDGSSSTTLFTTTATDRVCK